MRDVSGDPAALELLRVQRARLADRMRLPWWYVTGAAILWALVFALPFNSRYLPGVRTWPILLAASAVVCLMQWGLVRATGIKLPFRNLRHRSPGRPVGIAIFVVTIAAGETEHFLIDGGLTVVAVVVAVLAVATEMALLQASLRVTRRELRGGGAA